MAKRRALQSDEAAINHRHLGYFHLGRARPGRARPVQSVDWGVVMSEEAAPYAAEQLSDVDLLALDYDQKVKMLERVAKEILNYQVEFAQVSGRYAEIKANLEVLKQVKSALQSAIRAEQ